MRERAKVLILILLGLWSVNIFPGALSAVGMKQSNLVEIQFPTRAPFQVPSNWRGLVPLRTTRSEAERVLGQSKIRTGQRNVYKNETERVDVTYSACRCEPGERWNVAPDVVIAIEVYPEKSFLLEDLIFDKCKYVRQKWSHPHDWVTYRNEVEGIWIETTVLGGKTEEVRSIKYLPKTRDITLKCKQPVKCAMPGQGEPH